MRSAKRYQPPPRTGMEVFKMLPEGTLAELIDDVLHIHTPPNYFHQRLSMRIGLQIYPYVKKNKLGTCLMLPMDVYLDHRNIVQPDILFIRIGRLMLNGDDRIKGTPDLIVEILSPEEKRHDSKVKKMLYEKFGVKEYSVVDPATKKITTYYLSDKKFVKQETVKGKLKSKLLRKVFSF